MGFETRVLAGAQGIDEKLRYIRDRHDAAVLDKDPPDLFAVAVEDQARHLQLVDLLKIIGQRTLAVFACILIREMETETPSDQDEHEAHQPKGFALVETAFTALPPLVVALSRHVRCHSEAALRRRPASAGLPESHGRGNPFLARKDHLRDF